uniref:V-set and immunoglobulin domain containing 2 n=1 Tax=Varanus komodoensis TaxID=61221 RepID=A0A8D2IMI4_VARKO
AMELPGSFSGAPCAQTPGQGCISLTWPSFAPQILYFTSNTLYKPGAQAKRLHLLQDPPTLGIATIQLTDLRSSDAGIYTCEVNNPPDFYGTSFGQIELIVLMAPSSPVCRGTTSVSVGSNTTLTCNSTEGVPAPIYSWKRLDSKSPLPVSNTVQNEKTGTLELLNVSLALAGIYQCTSSNEFGQKTCQITLQVTGGVLGVLAGMAGCFLFIFLTVKKGSDSRNLESTPGWYSLHQSPSKHFKFNQERNIQSLMLSPSSSYSTSHMAAHKAARSSGLRSWATDQEAHIRNCSHVVL